jgi:spermidine/putrescine transport system permease protein
MAAASRRRPPLLATIVCLGLPAVAVLAPLASFLLLSLRSLRDGEVVDTLGFQNYAAFFFDATMITVYLRTVAICLVATLVNTAIGWLVALFVSRRGKALRFMLVMLFTLPLFSSYIIKIYAVRGILGHKGVLNEILIGLGVIGQPITALVFSYNAIFIAFVIIYLPFAILPIYLSMERIPDNLGIASADLGGSLLDEIRHIVFPLSRPGLAIAAIFSFLMTFGDFVTPQLVGGVEGFMFGRIVFTQFGLALDWPFGAALAVILLLTAAIVVAALGAFGRSRVTL